MKYTVLASLLFVCNVSSAQKTKTETFKVQYEKFPAKNIDDKYSRYSYKIIELPDGTFHHDSINMNDPINRKRAYANSEFQLVNPLIFPDLKNSKPADAEVEITLIYGCPQLLSKDLNIVQNYMPIQGGDPSEGAYTYRLTFYLPYKLLIKDKTGNEIYRDSSNSSHKIISYFPNQAFKQCSHMGLANQNVLDGKWKDLNVSFLRNEALQNLNGEIGLINSNLEKIFKYSPKEFMSFKYYYLSKKGEYSDLDSALNLFTMIFDSIKTNFKSQNHKNWHSESVKKNALQCNRILTKALNEFVTESKNTNESKRFDLDFVKLLLIDNVLAQWLAGNYKGAISDAKATIGKLDISNPFRDFYFEQLYDFIKTDKLIYENNKNKFGW